MAIARLPGTTAVSASAGTAMSITLPGTIPAGALIIVGAVNSLSSTFSTPTGFTAVGDAIADGTAGSAGVGFNVWYKVAAGTEAGTVVNTTASDAGFWCMMSQVYTGVDTTSASTIFAGHGSVIETGTDTTISTSTLTNDNVGSWGVFMFSYRSATTGGFTSYTPSGVVSSVTERGDVESSGTTKVFLALADTNGTMATGTGSVTGTSASSAEKVAWGAFIRPLISAGAVTATATAYNAKAKTSRGAGAPSAAVTVNSPRPKVVARAQRIG